MAAHLPTGQGGSRELQPCWHRDGYLVFLSRHRQPCEDSNGTTTGEKHAACYSEGKGNQEDKGEF